MTPFSLKKHKHKTKQNTIQVIHRKYNELPRANGPQLKWATNSILDGSFLPSMVKSPPLWYKNHLFNVGPDHWERNIHSRQSVCIRSKHIPRISIFSVNRGWEPPASFFSYTHMHTHTHTNSVSSHAQEKGNDFEYYFKNKWIERFLIDSTAFRWGLGVNVFSRVCISSKYAHLSKQI